MDAIKVIKQLEGTGLHLQLPQSFNNKKIEVIILKVEPIINDSIESDIFIEFQEFKLYRKNMPQLKYNADIDKIINTINNDIF